MPQGVEKRALHAVPPKSAAGRPPMAAASSKTRELRSREPLEINRSEESAPIAPQTRPTRAAPPIENMTRGSAQPPSGRPAIHSSCIPVLSASALMTAPLTIPTNRFQVTGLTSLSYKSQICPGADGPQVTPICLNIPRLERHSGREIRSRCRGADVEVHGLIFRRGPELVCRPLSVEVSLTVHLETNGRQRRRDCNMSNSTECVWARRTTERDIAGTELGKIRTWHASQPSSNARDFTPSAVTKPGGRSPSNRNPQQSQSHPATVRRIVPAASSDSEGRSRRRNLVELTIAQLLAHAHTTKRSTPSV